MRDRRLVVSTAVALLAVTATALVTVLVTVLVRRDPGERAPFAHLRVVYGRHVLTARQVSALDRAAGGRTVAVRSVEVDVAATDPAYAAVPVAAIVVDRDSYARAAATPALAAELARGLVLSTTGARLRRAAVGSSIRLADGRSLPVAGIVDDHLLGGHELAATAQQLPTAQGPSYLLVPDDVPARDLRGATPEIGLRVVARPRNGYVSSADTVLTPTQLKAHFGEFAVGRVGGVLRLDPGWRRTWLASGSVPQLGTVTCNRLVLGPLRAAMRELTDRGLGATVHTADFRRQGGCWSPRVVRLGDGGRPSSHAWGIAVDINVDANPLGERPRQDPRLVAVMRAHGFVWGGDFLRPDGAHFEWVGDYS